MLWPILILGILGTWINFYIEEKDTHIVVLDWTMLNWTLEAWLP